MRDATAAAGRDHHRPGCTSPMLGRPSPPLNRLPGLLRMPGKESRPVIVSVDDTLIHPPIPFSPPSPNSCSFGISGTKTSVVSIIEAIEPAFCS